MSELPRIVSAPSPETLPAEWYWSDEAWQIERREIWAKHWVLIGRAAQFDAPGDYVSTELAGYPIFAIKGKDGTVRAFHNVCRHRASPLVQECAGHVDRISCPYHRWLYDFEGRLKGAPSMEIDKDEYGLFPIHCAVWRGLVFVSIDPVAPIEQWLEDIAKAALRYPIEELHLAREFTIEAGVNWKTYSDNYAEAWHIPTIHPGLNASIDMASYRIDTVGDTLQSHTADARDGGKTDGFWVWRLPGLFFNMYNWGMNVAQLEPTGPRSMRLTYRYFVKDLDPAKQDERDALIDWAYMVAKEDIDICNAVQKNLEAGIYDRGRLSGVHENGVIQFQSLVLEAHRRNGPASR
ncbi:MAG: aromatic ring-hydroxylating dioxygenase subunit alpha [Parvibaculum sp.]|nr:aromatic ring-hydroxylating dioxygenase subunit alpha [Parvibaculum sp.]